MSIRKPRAPAIDHQAKQIIFNAYNYYKKRKLDKTTFEHQADLNLLDLVAEVTGITRGSAKNIIKEGNSMTYEDGFALFKPKEKKTTRKKRIVIDKITEGIIRRKVIQLPYLKKLSELLQKENILKCSREFLRQLLQKLGFSTENYPGLPGVLIENPEINSERMHYLQALKNHTEQDQSLFYLINTKNWEHDTKSPKDMPCFVMVHASGPGFIDEVQLMLKMKLASSDECFQHFENYDWMKDSVLPNIPPASVVIVDIPQNETLEANTSDKKPTLDSPTSALKDWLNHYNVPFKDTASKSELMKLIQNHEGYMAYSVTKLIEDSGHKLLCLPEKHSDLNPVAVMWYKVKDKVNETSAYELITKYSKKQWKDCILHIRENEAEYYAYGLKVNKQDYITNLKQTRNRS